MMNSLILKTAANFLLLITLCFSVWVLFRGHNSPGGGFIGGLLSASGFSLYLLAHGSTALRKLVKINFKLLLSCGLLFSLCSGLISVLQKKVFLTGVWIEIDSFKLGSPILFDVGIYLIVLSSVLIIVQSLAAESI
ncbi:Na+/H+ antiporter subunit B [Legionella jamestowniensis]|uniref:Na(+)/H(+) antiporter subunit B n=1 Tax=Legionella jamestowniensis TaxID=455 RepID=A0A0W0UZC5_9GAMM|nr:Na+/H+ antiporter subunit B [Legionella jamestowniensis]KTD13226.1 Na(+)/H(+) antiporter subunit B [Legionella jamestowniensis]SFL78443.1 multisubunit sodium/proton antiporter, MrpB subunit [Legionella jamestowniensis DSM 19215]